MLATTASESPEKTRHESQFLLSPQIEQHHRTGRPVVYADFSSTVCSEAMAKKKYDKIHGKKESQRSRGH